MGPFPGPDADDAPAATFARLRDGIADASAVILAARNVDEMVAATAGIRTLVDRLVDQRVPVDSVTRIVTSLNDQVARRLIAIVGGTSALDTSEFCWIALGSQGRCEQTLATDQDNAIIFADGGDVEARRRSLASSGRTVNEALDRCGFPLCRGEVMAGNPRWCLSASEWRARFAKWIDEPDPQALLHAAIFFDFRPIHGNHALADELRGWLAREAPDRGRFLLSMARNALTSRAPLGVLRDFILTRRGEHPGTLDLKVNGVQLFVEIARIHGLSAGVTATNTLARFDALATMRRLPAPDVAAWADAFRFIQSLRLRQNAAQRARSLPLHNHLDPATLNGFDRRVLKDALREAQRLQARAARDFPVANPSFGA